MWKGNSVSTDVVFEVTAIAINLKLIYEILTLLIIYEYYII